MNKLSLIVGTIILLFLGQNIRGQTLVYQTTDLKFETDLNNATLWAFGNNNGIQAWGCEENGEGQDVDCWIQGTGQNGGYSVLNLSNAKSANGFQLTFDVYAEGDIIGCESAGAGNTANDTFFIQLNSATIFDSCTLDDSDNLGPITVTIEVYSTSATWDISFNEVHLNNPQGPSLAFYFNNIVVSSLNSTVCFGGAEQS